MVHKFPEQGFMPLYTLDKLTDALHSVETHLKPVLSNAHFLSSLFNFLMDCVTINALSPAWFIFLIASEPSPASLLRLQIHALAYNIFNWFKRLVLPAKICKQQIDTIRLKLLKIAAKAVHSARYITFKLCSSCPYKDEFYETPENIHGLQPQLEWQVTMNLDSKRSSIFTPIGILRPFLGEFPTRGHCFLVHEQDIGLSWRN